MKGFLFRKANRMKRFLFTEANRRHAVLFLHSFESGCAHDIELSVVFFKFS